MQHREIEIINKLGLHARAASKFANLATRFECKITVELGEKSIDGKSIMSLMLLAAGIGTQIALTTDGVDEEAAMDALLELINNRFDEPE